MSAGRVRIISGKWRNRQLPVAVHDTLRPTPDRVRETLFNWLKGDVEEARCLDLFAGTGALGFEALSRGAKQTVFVEKNPKVLQVIKQSASLLKAEETADIVCSEAIRWLTEQDVHPFDVIFLDPPYQSQELPQIMSLLDEKGWVKSGTLIYVEMPHKLMGSQCPEDWQIVKEKKAGDVFYHLLEVVAQ